MVVGGYKCPEHPMNSSSLMFFSIFLFEIIKFCLLCIKGADIPNTYMFIV